MGEQQMCRAISREMLNPGDHICTKRWKGLYYHHGIYVGNDFAIHLLGPRSGAENFVMRLRSSSVRSRYSAAKLCTRECQNYGSKKGIRGGTVKTCLNCFLDGHSLYVYDYECNAVRSHVEKNGKSIKSPKEVMKLAYNELQQHYFSDNYDPLGRNCEHFATYCKTGLEFSMQSILWMTKIPAFVTGQKPVLKASDNFP